MTFNERTGVAIDRPWPVSSYHGLREKPPRTRARWNSRAAPSSAASATAAGRTAVVSPFPGIPASVSTSISKLTAP